MRNFNTFKFAIDKAREYLKNTGQIITSESWQGIKEPKDMFEAFDFNFQLPMYDFEKMKQDINPNLPWADEHFAERVSGIPYNPPPSHKIWMQGATDNFIQESKFSHTYPERFWPKGAGGSLNSNWGIRYKLGDLQDVVDFLYKEPNTRQAYLPVWFPEDTGAVNGQRVPCTLGYLFRQINGYLHITYKIRSCDIFRHFQDDIYLAIRLCMWMLEQLKKKALNNGREFDYFYNCQLGMFKMQIDSLHCFAIEKDRL